MKRTPSILALTLVIASVACTQKETTKENETKADDTELQTETGTTADTAAPSDDALPEPDALTASTEVRFPDNFSGTGILATWDKQKIKGSPEWANIRAEIIEKDGTRILATSAIVKGMRNQALARSTATNRARAELSRWYGQPAMFNTQISEVWQNKRGNTMIIRVEMPLEKDWQPPTDPKTNTPD
ncbi:hypothetical protein KAI87_06150 [Myxococcota bacterium]|nr:hypothetical protein [Myxococcota bacterium]